MPCPRAELRRWQVDDIDAVARAIKESHDHLAAWSTLAMGDPHEVASELVTTAVREWQRGESYKYAITVDGLVVGGGGLMRRIGPGGLEAGYWLHGDWTGKGLVTEAVGALVAAGSALDGIDRIEIRHDAANAASAAVPRRLGFTEVGRGPAPEGQRPRMPGESGTVVVWRKTCGPSATA
ncbi:GNAT family N-acetyltransferase [Streptomyces monticola]|uniref:GNAT family N-acetyltransferase n=1 Tax=Streptomyces monticola TaxID=2666263 RepID=A0ABW2JDH8_9ACTN